MENKVIPNRTQFQRLFEMLQEKPEIAQGFTKIPIEEVNAFWEHVQLELNSSGPPCKDATSWRKEWLDWKALIKTKLAQNKKECKATGGGANKMHSFTSLEEGVIRLTGLETSNAEIRDAHSFGFTNSAESIDSNANSKEDQLADVSMPSNVFDLKSMNMPKRISNTPRPPHVSNLLQEQIKLQQKFYRKTEEFWDKQEKSAEGISSNLRRIYRGVEKLCEIEERSLEETKRHNQIKEKLLQRKIDIKMQMVKNDN